MMYDDDDDDDDDNDNDDYDYDDDDNDDDNDDDVFFKGKTNRGKPNCVFWDFDAK